MAQHSKMIISGVLETLPRLNSDKKNLTLKEWRLKEWLNILRWFYPVCRRLYFRLNSSEKNLAPQNVG